jgi:hypothetical protein
MPRRFPHVTVWALHPAVIIDRMEFSHIFFPATLNLDVNLAFSYNSALPAKSRSHHIPHTWRQPCELYGQSLSPSASHSC